MQQQKPRQHSNVFIASLLTILVHALIVGLLLVSFNWQPIKPMQVAEVTLWDTVPKVSPEPKPAPAPEPEPVKETPEPEPPKPVKEPPKEKPPEEQPIEPKEDDIALQKKKAAEEKARIEKEKQRLKEKKLKAKKARELKKKKALAKLRKELNQEKKPTKAELEKLKAAAFADENAAKDAKAAAAKASANASIVAQYINKIQNKIRGNVNKSLCGDNNPELKFKVGLLPTGQLAGAPNMTKSSGSDICDEAVARAIMASEPLPLPDDSALFSEFRNLNLILKPND